MEKCNSYYPTYLTKIKSKKTGILNMGVTEVTQLPLSYPEISEYLFKLFV